MILDEIKGCADINDKKWTFTVADNDYRDKDPIKLQANGIYSRRTKIIGTLKKYNFGLIFRCSKKGGPLKLTRIIVSGDHNGFIRLQVRSELYEKFNYLKKSKMRLF